MPQENADLSVIILTLNEEIHIERCIRSAFQLASEVFVVDSFSDDRTVAIAESLGAHVCRNRFRNYASQVAWALRTLPIKTTWVMRVDADEVITDELAASARHRLTHAAPDVSGFLVHVWVRFMDRLIRHGNYPQWQLRIWRFGKGDIEQRWMDEHIVLQEGRTERLDGRLIDTNLKGITWWTSKHNAYATREAIDLLNLKYAFLPPGDTPSSPAARRKRWIKEHCYHLLPRGLRAALYFVYRMVFQLGVLDGRAGFTFHFLQGLWYRFLVDVKVAEVERRMLAEQIDCPEAIRRQFGVDPIYTSENNAKPGR